MLKLYRSRSCLLNSSLICQIKTPLRIITAIYRISIIMHVCIWLNRKFLFGGNNFIRGSIRYLWIFLLKADWVWFEDSFTYNAVFGSSKTMLEVTWMHSFSRCTGTSNLLNLWQIFSITLSIDLRSVLFLEIEVEFVDNIYCHKFENVSVPSHHGMSLSWSADLHICHTVPTISPKIVFIWNIIAEK